MQDSPQGLRFALYSGHDTGPMMPLLGVPLFREPYRFTPYASLLIELLERLGANGPICACRLQPQIMKVDFPNVGLKRRRLDGPWIAFRKRVRSRAFCEACRLQSRCHHLLGLRVCQFWGRNLQRRYYSSPLPSPFTRSCCWFWGDVDVEKTFCGVYRRDK